jgi:polar amino acid transport system permease protein
MPQQFIFNPTVIAENLHMYKEGISITITATTSSFLIGGALGLVGSMMRLSKKRWLSGPALAYIEIIRGTPVLVQLVWFYYCLPILLNVQVPAMAAAIIALSLRTLTMRRIILPQVMRRMLPPFLNHFIDLLKASSLISVLAIRDIMYQSTVIIETTYRPIEILSFAAFLYFMIIYPITILSRKVEKKFKILT